MAGPYPPDHGAGQADPHIYPYPENAEPGRDANATPEGSQSPQSGPKGSQPPGSQHVGPPFAGARPVGPDGPYPGPYPGMLPPPVPYPKRRRWPLVAAAVGAVVLVAAVAGAAVLITRNLGDTRTTASGAAVSEESARTAIQNYLDALLSGDDETVARHTLCGLFDAVKERRSDMSLAQLASDAFRKQFSRAEVTSIDKIVTLSPQQAQVLFTMRVDPARGARGGRGPGEQQAVAQVLNEDGQVLVCSYLPRTGGQY